MHLLVFFAALVAYLFFIIHFAWQSIIWFRASGHAAVYPVFLKRPPAIVCIGTVLDILFFRRIFNASKCLWIGSWVFHLSFFFVALRHMRYFFPSLPACLIFLQPVGLIAGYLLPLSLLYLIVLRTVKNKERYASTYNYIISGMLLLISSIGVVMRMFFRPDMLSVKQFSLGIFGLSPQPVPDSILFLLHIGLFLCLLPFLPTHIVAAPFVNLEANRRLEELRYVIHER
jgi:nitrate reductase gamma subunit